MEPFQPAHESDVAAPHVSKAVITTFSPWGAPAAKPTRMHLPSLPWGA